MLELLAGPAGARRVAGHIAPGRGVCGVHGRVGRTRQRRPRPLRFQHVAAGELPEGQEPDLRIQLASQDHTHEVCGNTFKLETSCFYSDGNRVVINESRWIRGAIPFQGDLGAYRQYVINHEVGHGIGFAAHQPCPKDGQLAPIMMQQTLSLNNAQLREMSPDDNYPDNPDTCRPNPWPYPRPAAL